MSLMEPIAVSITDGMVAALAKISSTLDATEWHTDVRTLRKGFYPGDEKLPAPSIFVEAEDEVAEPLQADHLHRATLKLVVRGVVVETGGPHDALWRLAKDMKKAIAADEYVGGLVIQTDGPEIQTVVPAARDSEAAVVLTYQVQYDWTHASP